MRCPWCGNSPVMIRGDRWECGWCGDSGKLSRSADAPQATISVTPSLSYHVDLPETWGALKTVLAALLPGRDAGLRPLLGEVLLHEISASIQRRRTASEAQQWQELREFLQKTPEQYYCNEAGEPSDILYELSSVCAYFEGDEDGEEETERPRRYAQMDAFTSTGRKSCCATPTGPGQKGSWPRVSCRRRRTSAGRSWWRNSRRRRRATLWRSWRTAPGGTSWTMCWSGTGQRGCGCGAPCWMRRVRG